MMVRFAGAGGLVECSISTTAKRRDVIARVFGQNGLAAHVFEGNRLKVMSAPATAIIGYDTRFYDWLPRRFPHRDMRSAFVDKPQFAETSAFRNSSLQGAYLMLAARALGLDCGPMSGFSNEGVDREFFPGGRVKSNFICAIGYGDPSGVLDRLPRPAFSEVCKVL
jgi:3-hydroxypropanoate dehydrogenase